MRGKRRSSAALGAAGGLLGRGALRPAAYSNALGDASTVVRMHSGNGEHGDMDERALICFAQKLDDAGLPDEPRLRATLKAYFSWAIEATNASARSKNDVPVGLILKHWDWGGPM
jgi:hemoglobin